MFIDLLISDEKSNQISVISPKDGKILDFEAKFAKLAVYPKNKVTATPYRLTILGVELNRKGND